MRFDRFNKTHQLLGKGSQTCQFKGIFIRDLIMWYFTILNLGNFHSLDGLDPVNSKSLRIP